LYKHSARSG